MSDNKGPIKGMLPCWCHPDTEWLRVKPHMDHGEFGCRERARFVYCSHCWTCGPAHATDEKAIEGWNKMRSAPADLLSRPSVVDDRLAEIRQRWSRSDIPAQLFSAHVKQDIDYLLSLIQQPVQSERCVKCGHRRKITAICEDNNCVSCLCEFVAATGSTSGQ